MFGDRGISLPPLIT